MLDPTSRVFFLFLNFFFLFLNLIKKKFSPPPAEIAHRLTWRTDDTKDVIEKRLKQVNGV